MVPCTGVVQTGSFDVSDQLSGWSKALVQSRSFGESYELARRTVVTEFDLRVSMR